MPLSHKQGHTLTASQYIHLPLGSLSTTRLVLFDVFDVCLQTSPAWQLLAQDEPSAVANANVTALRGDAKVLSEWACALMCASRAASGCCSYEGAVAAVRGGMDRLTKVGDQVRGLDVVLASQEGCGRDTLFGNSSWKWSENHLFGSSEHGHPFGAMPFT